MAMHVEVFRHRVDPDFQGEFDELYAIDGSAMLDDDDE